MGLDYGIMDYDCNLIKIQIYVANNATIEHLIFSTKILLDWPIKEFSDSLNLFVPILDLTFRFRFRES